MRREERESWESWESCIGNSIPDRLSLSFQARTTNDDSLFGFRHFSHAGGACGRLRKVIRFSLASSGGLQVMISGSSLKALWTMRRS